MPSTRRASLRSSPTAQLSETLQASPVTTPTSSGTPTTATTTAALLPSPTLLAKNGTIIVTVTGATGYLGEHLVKSLLEQGYQVRGTVRNVNDQEKLKALKALPGATERLTFYQADLLIPGSFDAAVEGADYVIHSASPVALEIVKDPQEMLVRPAVEGTQNVFNSVEKATTVKRVVLTSSFRSVFGLGDEHPKGYMYTENDWNTKSSLENNQGYALSKILAERAAWVYADKEAAKGKDQKWDMVVINPGLIFGPLLSKHHTEAFSIQIFQQLVTGELPPVKLPWPVVDIRDVAKVHVRALAEKEEEAEEGEGEGVVVREKKAHPDFVIPSGRYLVNSGTLSLREILDQVRDLIWRPLMRISVPKPFLWVGFYTGFVGNKLSKDDIVHNIGNRILFSNEKAVKAGLLIGGEGELIKPRETFRDMYATMQEFKIVGTYN